MRVFRFKVISFIAIAALGCSCGKKEVPLDRDTALSLLHGQGVKQVEIGFSVVDIGQARSAYQELANAGLLVCGNPDWEGWRQCQPSNTSGISNAPFAGGLRFTVGTTAPTAVTGVTQTGPNSAMAEVELSFRSAPLYAQYQAAFDALYAQDAVQPISGLKQARTMQATFQRYDDGWRLQGIQ